MTTLILGIFQIFGRMWRRVIFHGLLWTLGKLMSFKWMANFLQPHMWASMGQVWCATTIWMLHPKLLFKATPLHSTLPINVSVRRLRTGKLISIAPFAGSGLLTRRQILNAQSRPLFTLSVLAWEEWQLANPSKQIAWIHQLHQSKKLL